MAVSLWLTVLGKFINSSAAPRTFEAQPLTFLITSPGKGRAFPQCAAAEPPLLARGH